MEKDNLSTLSCKEKTRTLMSKKILIIKLFSYSFIWPLYSRRRKTHISNWKRFQLGFLRLKFKLLTAHSFTGKN